VRVTLLATEGRGGTAEIELDGRRLRVVDGISAADRPESPGPVANPKLEVVVDLHRTGPAPPASTGRMGLEPDHGWRYHAHGQIVSTSPLRADLGPLCLDLDPAAPEDWAVGDRISVAIDRIVLTRECS